MKSNLYQYFNCSNREELYSKIKSDDKDVKEIVDFIEFSKSDLRYEKEKLQGREGLKEYLKDNPTISENEIRIVMLDHHLNLVKGTKVDIDSSFKEVMQKSYHDNAKLAILLYHKGDPDKVISNKDKIEELKNNLELLNYKILETLSVDKELKVFSDVTDDVILTLPKENITSEKNISDTDKEKDFTKASEYNEFMNYYAKKELVGLNVINDKKIVKEILKASYQELRQENFGVIEYDKNFKITDVNVLFKGGQENVNIDPKIILPHLLNDQIRGIEIFHNHPGGKSVPSKQDTSATNDILEIADRLGKEFSDHYIVSKEDVFSYKEEWLLEEKKGIDKSYEMREKETPKWEKKNKFKEEREKFVDGIIKSLEGGKIPWEKDWDNLSGAVQNPITGTKYKGINNIRLYAAMIEKGYTDNRWVTYNQASTKGWQVRKGEKATPIEIFKFYDKSTKKDLDLKMYNDLPPTERVKYYQENVYIVGKIYSVFNGEQIEGIPPSEHKKIEVDYNKLDKIIENSGVTFKYGGNEAYYNKVKDMIILPAKEQFKSEGAFYGTALHELAHSTGHETRLNRAMEGGFGSEKYAREELVAEFASVFIGQEKGVGYTERNLENSKAYIQNWIDVLKNDKNELFTAIKEAEKASEMVVGYELGKVLNIAISKEKGIER